MLKRFGARLSAVRRAGGVTQQRLADAVAMSPKTISGFEGGALAPTLSTVALLAQALHVRVEDLLRNDVEPAVARPDTAEEADALADFRALNAAQRHAVTVVLRGLRAGGGGTNVP